MYQTAPTLSIRETTNNLLVNGRPGKFFNQKLLRTYTYGNKSEDNKDYCTMLVMYCSIWVLNL